MTKKAKLTKDDRLYIKEMDQFIKEHKARYACNVECLKHAGDVAASLKAQARLVKERLVLTTKDYQAWRVRHGLKRVKIL